MTMLLTIVCTTGSAEPQGEVGSLAAPTGQAWGDAWGRDPPPPWQRSSVHYLEPASLRARASRPAQGL